jgi:hypothetical protein
MTARSRSLPWLVAAVLASVASTSLGQDTPLYRDPSPTEGPKVEGPLLPPVLPRPSATPSPPSTLGPFQTSNPGLSELGPPEVPHEPLLVIPPMPPPLAAMPMPPMQTGGDVQIKRKTTIRPPHGPLSRCFDWFHDNLFATHKGTVTPTSAKRGHPTWFSYDGADDPPPRFFKWPSWPSWPLQADR